MISANRCRLSLILVLLAPCAILSVRAEEVTTVEVEVTAVFEESVYLDKGWANGIGQDDVVRIVIDPQRTISAKVQSVSSHDSRCVPLEGIDSIRVGMRGHVNVELPQTSESAAAADASSAIGADRDAVAQVDFQEDRARPGAIERVPARVTATSGSSVYLNKGRDAGLQPGDEVTFFPANDGIVNGTVQSVSGSSVRCTVLSSLQNIDIGTRAEVLIPANRRSLDADDKRTTRPTLPEHPPWTATPENWDQEQPLLAPAHARTADQRDVQLHGRLFASYMHTLNQFDASNQYSLGRIGAALWMDNPFGRGGGLHLDSEFNRRGVFLADDVDGINGPGRLDRLSYHWGGTEEQPLRLEMGRFLSYEIPEFGVVDGTELMYRTDSGHRFGVSVGLLPEPFPNLSVVDDLHVGVFYRWVRDPDETLSSAIAFQKTWYHGTPDRDLLIWSTDYDPNPYVSVYSTVWVDFYDSRDTLKTTDAEVTQAIVQPIIRINPRHGLGASISSIRWPQLLRREFSPFVEQQIIGDSTYRWGLFTWHDVGLHTRLDGRVDQWYDQNHQTGTSWEGRVAFRDWLYDHGEVAFAIFDTQGLYSSGPGGRVSLNRRYEWCFASLRYSITDSRLTEQSRSMGVSSDLRVLLQHSVHANLDFTVSSDKSVSLFTDYQFGYSRDAIQAGIFLQKRL